jgi:hypothetical protein
MKPGNDLFGTWVMFDVMHQITTGWLIFSAHNHDHNYQALCTILACKLLAKDADSCKIAWTNMIEIAGESGVTNFHIHGFMADNAGGGWNAVQNIFFDGVCDPERERSHACHWAQSI